MASAVLATIGAMRAKMGSMRSAGPAALIAPTGRPAWSRTAAPQQAAASLNSLDRSVQLKAGTQWTGRYSPRARIPSCQESR